MFNTGACAKSHFFAMNDCLTGPVPLTHREYGDEVRTHFYDLFPGRQRRLLADRPDASPLPVSIEILYPTADEPFYFVHTVGMSAAPMHYPSEADLPGAQETYSELCLLLPADWPFADPYRTDLQERNAWPLRMLRDLAKFPHAHQLWMSYGFILPNSEQGEPFAGNTALCGALIVQFEGELGELRMHDGTAVQLLLPVLIYQEEMDAYDEWGADGLMERILEGTDDSFLLRLDRPNVAQ